MTIPLEEHNNTKLVSSPLSPLEEFRIVKQLITKSELNLAPGNLYYLLSKRWFSRWEKYVGHNIDNPLADTDSGDVVSPPIIVADRPGPIDNSDIIENEHHNEGADLDILTTLLEGKDYVLVPQKVWERLVQWYSGGPALPRKMISQGLVNMKHFSVEVYPLRLKLIDSRDNSEHTIRISKKASLHKLYETVCSLRGIEKEKASIWDYFNKHKDFLLSSSNKTLEESNLLRDQEILLELKHNGCYSNQLGEGSAGNQLALVPIEPSRSSISIAGGPMMSNGQSKLALVPIEPSRSSMSIAGGPMMSNGQSKLALVPIEPSRSSMSIAGGPMMSNGQSSSYSLNLQPGSASNSAVMDIDNGFGSHSAAKIGDKGGLAGLQNMGNTCFMNSAIQCLVHTPPLVEYFLQDYSDEINSQNPLGMRGELALAFGELLRKLWLSGRTTIAPRAFKGKLSQFAPQFSGYNQHDSQELLAFLLDGLHEDLNRVKKKPYMEMKDWSNHPDDEVADECWKYHNARNDSVIVDVCQGQYKSTLVCPVCGKISITFDPFMYLSLPLPSTVTRPMTVTVFCGDGSGLPTPYTVSVLKSGNCGDLQRALGGACSLRNDENLLLAEVYEHKIYRFLENPLEPLISIKDEHHIVAYRLPGKAAGKMRLEIIHLEKSVPEALKGSVSKYFGAPLITYLEADVLSGADINDAVSRLLSPLRRTCSPVVAHGGKENGFLSVANGEASNSCDDQCHIRDQSLESTELKTASSPEMLFHLSSTDDRCLSSKPIFKDSVIKLSNRLKIFVEWTEKEKRLYDPSYIKDLPEVYHKTGFSSKKTKQEAISLFSCLEAFLKEEPLGPDDMWYCPTCKEHRQANKKLDLWRLPDILVFHLKRFSYGQFLKNKLDTFVDFPIHDLDLSKYVKKKDGQSCVYELYAISNHYGGLGGGHYTAFAKLMDDIQWYNFDDGRVSPASEAEIRTSAAYVLFYQRVKTGAGEGLEGSSHSYLSS